MSERPDGPDPGYGENTRAVHTPDIRDFDQRPMGLPVYRTASFGFRTAQEFADLLAGRTPGFSYSRIDNPTAAAFADGMAHLEGAEAGEAFASGMAAASAVLLGYLSAGDHVVCAAGVYGGTWALLSGVLARFGVTAAFVDMTDLGAVRAAVTDRTRLLWAETIANPTLSVVDLPALAGLAHAAGALLVIDSTFATPALCRPLEHGADLVMHSATKYVGGHSDVTGGVVVGPARLLAPVRQMRTELGGSLSPDDAFLLHRGLATLPLRMARHSATAMVLAQALDKHPAVQRVRYPGLPSHPQHELAGALFEPGRYGGIVTVDPAGGRAAGMAFCDGLRLARNASSLAGTHTIVSHVASSTHRQLDEAALALAGITPATVRISVGLEDADDLVADCSRALDAAAG
jgi:cystathionine beta-lyase/cystathionine gamma-synthase